MRYSVLLAAAAALPALVSAYPAGRRNTSDTDVLVFRFADVLEQLESQFYLAALDKFKAEDITGAGFQDPTLVVEQLKTIQADEATHATVLEDALASFGKEPISSQCKFNFDSVLTDITTTLATARVVENIGVTAYVGAAHLLDDPVLLSAAASIATVEARHQTVLNILAGTGTVIPQAFDVALTPSEVLAMAGPFISGCDLGVPANTPLAIDPASPKAGDTITFKSAALNDTVDSSNFHCQILVGGAAESTSLKMSECKIPDGTNGPITVWITSDDQPLANDVVNRATDKQIAGPVLTFVDAQSELLPTLVRQSGASGTQSGATVTSTVSVDDAKKIVDGANSTTDNAAQVNTVSSGSDSTDAGSKNEFTGETKAGGVSVVGWGEIDA